MKRHALPLLLALVPLLAAPAALAQSWPTKQVSLIIPSAPGGPSDVLGRVLADKLRERYAQPFVVENRGGAGGNLGTAAVARAAGDGYTLLITVDAPIVVNPALSAHGGYARLEGVDGEKAFVTMGGGCQGCAVSAVTLREGIEAAILEAIPEITRVEDATDHTAGANPFY